jgi:hypothetical protein
MSRQQDGQLALSKWIPYEWWQRSGNQPDSESPELRGPLCAQERSA